MTRYLLDTNIISNVVKPQPSTSLLAWMAAQRDEDLFIASLTIAEIRRGRSHAPGFLGKMPRAELRKPSQTENWIIRQSN